MVYYSTYGRNCQSFAVSPGANSGGIATTNGLDMRIGGWSGLEAGRYHVILRRSEAGPAKLVFE